MEVKAAAMDRNRSAGGRRRGKREFGHDWLYSGSNHGGKVRQLFSQTDARLPVLEQRSKILAAFRNSDVLIVIGDTGSGKTTQIPQILLDSGWDTKGRLVSVTQPRRVAAMTVASRVATERGCELGGEVSYAVRFDDCTTSETRLRYVTDGVLLREALQDKRFSAYAAIVVDEVHERSINTDVLLGIAKKATEKRRGDLKLIVMSATADALKLQRYFNSKLRVDTLQIPGRLYRIELLFTAEPVTDYLDAAITAAMQVHFDESMPGDILVFLSGQEEIDSARTITEDRMRKYLAREPTAPKLVVRALYAALPPKEQLLAIEPLPAAQRRTVRKVLFATNVAETSVTIRGVKYVVDSGVAKVRTLNTRTGADVLRVAPISKAQARQRGGRAGRETEGKCFRLYPELAYEKMDNFPVPEILRCDLAAAVLHLVAMGVENPVKFDFLDSPPRRAVANALELLYSLSALDENMCLTELGQKMSAIPLPPMLSKCVLEAEKLNCLPCLLALASMLTVESPFTTPRGKREVAVASRKRFSSPHGDHISLYNAFRAYLRTPAHERDKFCQDYYINSRSMTSAESIRLQLADIFGEDALALRELEELESDLLDSVRKSIVSGYFRNVARLRAEDNKYVTLGGGSGLRGGVEVDIHPSSALRALRKQPTTILFHEVVLTTKSYVRNVLEIDRAWLLEMNKNFYRTEGTS